MPPTTRGHLAEAFMNSFFVTVGLPLTTYASAPRALAPQELAQGVPRLLQPRTLVAAGGSRDDEKSSRGRKKQNRRWLHSV